MSRKKGYCCGHGKNIKADSFHRLTACAQPGCIGEPCNELVTCLNGRMGLPSTRRVDVFVLRSAFPSWKDETRPKSAPNLCKGCVDVAAAAADAAKAAAAAAALLQLLGSGGGTGAGRAPQQQQAFGLPPLAMPLPASGGGGNGTQLPPSDIAMQQPAATADRGVLPLQQQQQQQQQHGAVPAAAPGMQPVGVQPAGVQLGRTAVESKRRHARRPASPRQQQEGEGRVVRRRAAPGAVAGAAGDNDAQPGAPGLLAGS